MAEPPDITAQTRALIFEADSVVESIRPLLAGLSGDVQGMVIAELFAMWLAGHRMPDNPAEQTTLRGELLARTVQLAIDLIPVCQMRQDEARQDEALRRCN